jgi:hypothetical protein
MTTGLYFRLDFVACGIGAARPVLFGTTGLSGVSAFGTAAFAAGGGEPATAP